MSTANRKHAQGSMAGSPMRCRRSKNHIELCALAAPAFKTLTLRMTFLVPLTKDKAAAGALIPMLLRRGTRTYPDLASLSRYCEELFGVSVKATTAKVGHWQVPSLTLRFAAPCYLPRRGPKIDAYFRLARELLCDPAGDGRQFQPDIFESEKLQLVRSIQGLSESKLSYALRRGMEIAFSEAAYAMPEYGSERDVETLGNAKTWNIYRELLRRGHFAIYLSGPMRGEEYLPRLERTFGDLRRGTSPALALNQIRRAPGRLRVVTERQDMEQAFIVLTHATGINLASPAFTLQRFANAMFGRISTSRLFRVVREEEGLAYSVGSYLDSTSGLSVCYAGTDPAKWKQARALMREQLRLLRDKGFSDQEFEAARNYLIEDLLADVDSPGSRISDMLIQRSVGIDKSMEQWLEEIKQATPQQVRDAYACYRPCSEYRLLPR